MKNQTNKKQQQKNKEDKTKKQPLSEKEKQKQKEPVSEEVSRKIPKRKNLGPSGQPWDI